MILVFQTLHDPSALSVRAQKDDHPMKRNRSAAPHNATVRLPREEWRDSFKAHSCRVGLQLNLTRPQLEFLCATADGVQWDRAAFGAMGGPNNFMASARALFKRGLIAHRDFDERDRDFREQALLLNFYGAANWELTPAGRAVVELAKLAGIFVEADAAIVKKLAARS